MTGGMGGGMESGGGSSMGGQGNLSGMLGAGGGGMGGDTGMGGGMGRTLGVGGMSSGGMGGDMTSGGMNPGVQWYITQGLPPPTVYQQVTYSLFRYFDFDVEANKSYQYKVRLAVKNPNLFVADKYLDEDAEKTKRQPIFWTEFSDPSGPATALATSRVLVQDVDFTNTRTGEATAKITSVAFDESEKADYILKDQPVMPGMMLNFLKKSSSKAPDLSLQTGGMGGSMSGGGSMGMTGGASSMSGTAATTAKPKASMKTLDHLSGECVLDVIGKRRLAGTNNDHASSGQIMLMGFDGTIKLQSPKIDKQELDRYDKKQTAATDMMSM
jgi:hypothetical protein